MSRCVICDASSSGLSMYRPDGKYTAHKFHQMDDGDFICNECYEEHKDVEYDFNLEDSLEEDGDAFEYDQ